MPYFPSKCAVGYKQYVIWGKENKQTNLKIKIKKLGKVINNNPYSLIFVTN